MGVGRFAEQVRELSHLSCSRKVVSEVDGEPYEDLASPFYQARRQALAADHHSLTASHLDFYTERTNANGQAIKNKQLQEQDFVEKCNSDTVALDDANNSYLEHVRRYNRVRGSISAGSRGKDQARSNRSGSYQTGGGAVQVLDQSMGHIGGQASFSLATKGELQQCIQNIHNSRNAAHQEAPSAQTKKPNNYSNVLSSTPARAALQPQYASHVSCI